MSSSFSRHMVGVGSAAAIPSSGSRFNTESNHDRCIELPVTSYSIGEAKRRLDEVQEAVMQRPAKKQVESSAMFAAAYTEGQEGYNIWYHKFSSNPSDGYGGRYPARDVADTRCNPDTDSGYTRAETIHDSSSLYYCYHFSRGCCAHGEKCQYRHRLPTEEDEFGLDASRDVFGRERHAEHRDDMGGVGTFTSECKTIYIGKIHVDKTKPTYDSEHLLKVIATNFGIWGPIENLRVLPRKGIAFLTYCYRVTAEFAKVAMSDQSLGNCGSVINVRWAHELSKNAQERIRARNTANAAAAAKSALGGNPDYFKNLVPPAGGSSGTSQPTPSAVVTNAEDDYYLDLYLESLTKKAEESRQSMPWAPPPAPAIGPATPGELAESQKQQEAVAGASRMQSILRGIDSSFGRKERPGGATHYMPTGDDPFKVVI